MDILNICYYSSIFIITLFSRCKKKGGEEGSGSEAGLTNYGQEGGERCRRKPIQRGRGSFCALNWVGRYLRNMLLNNNGVRG